MAVPASGVAAAERPLIDETARPRERPGRFFLRCHPVTVNCAVGIKFPQAAVLLSGIAAVQKYVGSPAHVSSPGSAAGSGWQHHESAIATS